jgi:phytanoyl-CoA hydroxylase
MHLTADEIESWHANGYHVIEDVFAENELERLRTAAQEFDRLAEGLTESTDRIKLQAFGETSAARLVQQVAEPHELGGEWAALSRDPRILDPVESLLGPNILLYYSMMMMKPARQGFTAPWHQDFAFFVHDRADLLACQVYLDDSTVENGCVRVVPGSHKLGLLNHFSEGRFTEVVQGDTSSFDSEEVLLPVRAGSIAFWHALTLHSSHANRSERARRTVVFEYKNPAARLMGGSFAPGEVGPGGMMVRGADPNHQLLSAL